MDAVATLVVAIAGPLGIALGWWLAHRSERERLAREERRSAYASFIRAAALYRNSPVRKAEDVAALYGNLAELILVAPTAVFAEAWALVQTGADLVDLGDEVNREPTYDTMYRHFVAFSDRARADLSIPGSAFGSVSGLELTLGRPADNAPGDSGTTSTN
ncbi:MAG: hypothetical protein M3R57_06785 [Chloroflexota bacterium]|nr:hypothetical protein [Chloroflexota bacterium]